MKLLMDSLYQSLSKGDDDCNSNDNDNVDVLDDVREVKCINIWEYSMINMFLILIIHCCITIGHLQWIHVSTPIDVEECCI